MADHGEFQQEIKVEHIQNHALKDKLLQLNIHTISADNITKVVHSFRQEMLLV